MNANFKLSDIPIVPVLSAETTAAIESAMRIKPFNEVKENSLVPVDLTQFIIIVNNVYVYDDMIRISIMMNGCEVSIYAYSSTNPCQVYKNTMNVLTCSGDFAVSRLNAVLIRTQTEQFCDMVRENWTKPNVTWSIYTNFWTQVRFNCCCGQQLAYASKIWDDARPYIFVNVN